MADLNIYGQDGGKKNISARLSAWLPVVFLLAIILVILFFVYRKDLGIGGISGVRNKIPSYFLLSDKLSSIKVKPGGNYFLEKSEKLETGIQYSVSKPIAEVSKDVFQKYNSDGWVLLPGSKGIEGGSLVKLGRKAANGYEKIFIEFKASGNNTVVKIIPIRTER